MIDVSNINNLFQIRERHNCIQKWLSSFCILLFIVVVLKNAWICDDAFITFRTIGNFINGYGLSWNIQERVQAYSHPLWMFLLSALCFFTREVFFITIFFSIALTCGVLLIFASYSYNIVHFVLGVIVLTLSKAFVDFSTSGLENPLTHFLLSIFFIYYFKSQITLQRLLLLFFIAAAGTLNRMDIFVLFLPLLFYAFKRTWQLYKWKAFFVSLAGFFPFILWECFALLYYGFLLPNTVYAKLINRGISNADSLKQGLYYVLHSIQLDPLTLLVILLGMTIPLFTERKCAKNFCVSFAILLYLVYVIYIGGDFMSGRFFTAPLLCSVILFSILGRLVILKRGFLTLFFLLIVGTAAYSQYRFFLNKTSNNIAFNKYDVSDQRGHNSEYLWKIRDSVFDFSAWSNISNNKGAKQNSIIVSECGIGLLGLQAGPNTYIVDVHALSDAFLARISPEVSVVGHFRRKLPEGYLETLRMGQNVLVDKKLAKYYDKLSLVTRGEIFNLKRIMAIFNLNFKWINVNKLDDI